MSLSPLTNARAAVRQFETESMPIVKSLTQYCIYATVLGSRLYGVGRMQVFDNSIFGHKRVCITSRQAWLSRPEIGSRIKWDRYGTRKREDGSSGGVCEGSRVVSCPLENAIAERVNGILKQELLAKSYTSFSEATR